MTLRNLVLTTALVPVLVLGACAGTKNRGLESVHQPVVSRTDYALDVATSGNRLAPGEAQRLGGWMATMRLGYGDHIAIDDPNPYGTGVREDVAREVSRYGLLVSDETPLTDAPVATGMIRVVVSRMKATVPGCPDFSRTSSTDFEGNTGSNQGCATNANLAAMIADPADLVRGQIGTGINDANTSGKAVNTYRTAPTTGSGGLKIESAGGGK